MKTRSPPQVPAHLRGAHSLAASPSERPTSPHKAGSSPPAVAHNHLQGHDPDGLLCTPLSKARPSSALQRLKSARTHARPKASLSPPTEPETAEKPLNAAPTVEAQPPQTKQRSLLSPELATLLGDKHNTSSRVSKANKNTNTSRESHKSRTKETDREPQHSCRAGSFLFPDMPAAATTVTTPTMPTGPCSAPSPAKSSPHISTEALQVLRAQQSTARGHAVLPAHTTDEGAAAVHADSASNAEPGRRQAPHRGPQRAAKDCRAEHCTSATASQQQVRAPRQSLDRSRSLTTSPAPSARSGGSSFQLHDSPGTVTKGDAHMPPLPWPYSQTPPHAGTRAVSPPTGAKGQCPSAALSQPHKHQDSRKAGIASRLKTPSPVLSPSPLPTPIPGPLPSECTASMSSRRSERQRNTREWIARQSADLDELQSALLMILIAPRLPRDSGSAPSQGTLQRPASHGDRLPTRDRGRSCSVAGSSRCSRGVTMSPLRTTSDAGECAAASGSSGRSRSKKSVGFRSRSAMPPARVNASKKKSPYLASILPAATVAPKLLPTPSKGVPGHSKPPVIGALKEPAIKPRVATMACQRKQI
jgi:hypothetical protein